MAADEAIVLVGGRGTRLRTLVSDIPKPLAPVAGRPFLAWVLDHLAASGIRRVLLATGYLAAQVEAAIGNRWQGMQVDYSVEDVPLGTGGAVRQAAQRLQGDAVHVLNGDTFLRYAPAALEAAARAAQLPTAVALAHVEDVSRYGAVVVDSGRIARFEEKGGHAPGLINAGSYFLDAEALASLPDATDFSLENAFLAPQAAAGRVAAFSMTEGFIDIGVPGDYIRAQALFARPA
jgi:D-glycero-alpha-D-manno-heptose 1-phosphate guanylyltransferase